MQFQISWLLKKPTDLDLHCLLRQGILCSAREGLIQDFLYITCIRMPLITVYIMAMVMKDRWKGSPFWMKSLLIYFPLSTFLPAVTENLSMPTITSLPLLLLYKLNKLFCLQVMHQSFVSTAPPPNLPITFPPSLLNTLYLGFTALSRIFHLH